MTTIVSTVKQYSFPTRFVQVLHWHHAAASASDDVKAAEPTGRGTRRREQLRCEPSSLMVGVMSRYGGRI